MQPSPARSLAGGLIGALMALLGIFIGNTVARMSGGEHAEGPAAVHEQQH